MTSCLALMTYWLTAHGCVLRRFYVRGQNSPVPVLAFMATHSAAAIGAPLLITIAPGQPRWITWITQNLALYR